MKVIEGKFGKNKEETNEVSTSEFLSVFVVKAMEQEDKGRYANRRKP